jgi:hypothetical protein
MGRGDSMWTLTGIAIYVVLYGDFSTWGVHTPLNNFLYSLFYSYLIENWILHTRPQFTSFINVKRGTCPLIPPTSFINVVVDGVLEWWVEYARESCYSSSNYIIPLVDEGTDYRLPIRTAISLLCAICVYTDDSWDGLPFSLFISINILH